MKPTRVIMVGEAEKTFGELLKSKKKEHSALINSIKQKSDMLKDNPHFGDPISKKKIPQKYFKQGFTNLFRIPLTGYWRMLYSLKGNEVEIISFILEILDHKKYEKLFGYKKS